MLPVASRLGQPILRGARLMMLGGFGGMLALLVFLGISSVNVLIRVGHLDAESTRLFIARDDSLEAVRQSAYQVSSRVRDYLLDPHPTAPARHREEAQEAWRKNEAVLSAYREVSSPEAASLLRTLDTELAEYWTAVTPCLTWNDEQRQRMGYTHLAENLVPIRERFLSTLDQIRVLDQQQLRKTIQRSAALISSLQERLVTTIVVILLVGFGLAGFSLLYLIRLENTARSRFEDLLSAHVEMEKLSQRILEVQEEERRKIARELHDEVSQTLGAILVDLGHIEATGAQARHLEAVKRLTERAIVNVRNLCLLLRPSMLDDLGLIPALHWQARETMRRTGIQVSVMADESELELPDSHRTAVYRVVQEALANAARHSGATQVHILVRPQNGRLQIVIEDNGCGFDPRHTRGLGLLGMQERVSHLNGEFHIETSPGKGTILRIELPLPVAARLPVETNA